MKIILSHDVDHLYWHDHLFDTWWPGLILRTSSEFLNDKISLSIVSKRLYPSKNLHNLFEICEFLIEHNVRSTFFFGMRKGLNLSYHYLKTKPALDFILNRGFDAGVHGIAFNDKSLMAVERQRFIDLTGLEPIGIRIHYLRLDDSTHMTMESLGYRYDSTERRIDFPHKIGKLWSIPISIMDVDVIHGSCKKHFLSATKETLARIEEAEQLGIPFFVINFHDCYFSESYPVHLAYFKWLIENLLRFHYEFISYDQAVDQLNSL